MEPKKNPKADLTRNSSLYFLIGLVAILFISWRAIEWKKYDTSSSLQYTMNIEQEAEEEIPITEQVKTPPPPPPAPEVIEVVEDEAEVEETVIESTETTQEEKIVEVKEVEVAEEDVDVDVPFAIIEDSPVFPGCENVAKDKKKDCFQEKMQQHISKNFRYPEVAQEMGIQGRVNVVFTIDKDGSITNIRTRGPDKNLEAEAKRIIEKLPKMNPGKQRGKPVRVPFSIPITFRLN